MRSVWPHGGLCGPAACGQQAARPGLWATLGPSGAPLLGKPSLPNGLQDSLMLRTPWLSTHLPGGCQDFSPDALRGASTPGTPEEPSSRLAPAPASCRPGHLCLFTA